MCEPAALCRALNTQDGRAATGAHLENIVRVLDDNSDDKAAKRLQRARGRALVSVLVERVTKSQPPSA